MKTHFALTRELCLTAGMGLWMAVVPVSAAVTDLVNVKINVSTSIGKTILPPGDYTVRTIQDSGNSAVIEFTSANGHSVNAIVHEIPVPGGEGATHSSVILRAGSGGYQVDKVWVEGRDYGYQLVSAESR